MDGFCQLINHAETRIGMTQLRMLLLLAKAGRQGAIMTDVASALGISPGAVSRQVDKLGRRGVNVGKRRRDVSKCMGLVWDRECDQDYKAVRIGLTEKGEQWLDNLEHEIWPTAKPGSTIKVN